MDIHEYNIMKIALSSLKMGAGGKVVNLLTEFNYFIVLYTESQSLNNFF